MFRLDVGSREDASSARAMRILEGATGVFFTGGDQLKITSQIGDTPLCSRVQEIFERPTPDIFPASPWPLRLSSRLPAAP